MPMQKKANGANFATSGGGAMTVRFESGGPAVVYVVCIWGPKPQFGGQRPKVWCSETLTAKGGKATVTIPEGMAMAGAQVTWSGGLIAAREAQGRLLVTVEQAGAEASAYAYEYSFAKKNQAESFYDGLNFA
jgi:hypothetical protein